MSTKNTTTIEQPAPAAVRSKDGLERKNFMETLAGVQKPPESGARVGSSALFGVIIQAGTDPESGRPRLVVETTEQQLRDLATSPYGKQCRVEVLEIIPAQMTPNDRTERPAGEMQTKL